MKLVRQGLVRKSLSSLTKDFQEPKFIQKLISELAPVHITLKQDLLQQVSDCVTAVGIDMGK